MSGRRSFHFRESLDILMRARWVAPYLLIPPMLAFMVYAEGYLSESGLLGSFSVQQRTVLALWNATILLALAAGIKSCLFFAGLWGSRWFRNTLALPVSRSSGYWGPVLAMLVVSLGMYALATGAVAAALPHVAGFPWLEVLIAAILPVAWAVCFGAALGLLTPGPAGSVLFSAVLLLGFLLGLPSEGAVPGWLSWAMPPIGRTLSASLSSPLDLRTSGVLLVHSVLALAAGRLLYGFGISRR